MWNALIATVAPKAAPLAHKPTIKVEALNHMQETLKGRPQKPHKEKRRPVVVLKDKFRVRNMSTLQNRKKINKLKE